MKSIFAVLVFLALCGVVAEVGKQLYEGHVERQQRLKMEKEEYIDELKLQCKLRHPLDYMERVICYDDLLKRRSFV